MDTSTKIDRRFVARKELTVFSDPQLTIPRAGIEITPGEFIKFTKDKVRGGKHVLFLSGSHAGYVEWTDENLSLCQQASVKDTPINLLEGPYELISRLKKSIRSDVKSGSLKKGAEPVSRIVALPSGVMVDIVNGGKEKLTIGTYKTLIPDVAENLKLFTIKPKQKFYYLDNEVNDKVKTLFLPDGRVGLSSFHSEMYKSIDLPHERIINATVIILTLLVSLASVLYILSETGYIIFAVLGMIVIWAIVMIFIGLPLLALTNFVRRRI